MQAAPQGASIPMVFRSRTVSRKACDRIALQSRHCNRRSCSSTTRPQTQHQHRQLEVCARLVPSKRCGSPALERHTSNIGLKSVLAWFHSIADAASFTNAEAASITAAHAQRLSYPHAPLQRNSSQFCLKGALCTQDSSNPRMRDHHAGSTLR